jgi:glycolate oxidase FAD binding subunit
VLGAKLMDAKGEVLNFGGQVMKNVAGYDVARAGRFARHPRPDAPKCRSRCCRKPVREATLRFELDERRCASALNEWGGKPLPVSASVLASTACWRAPVRRRAAVKLALVQLGGEPVPAPPSGTACASRRMPSSPRPPVAPVTAIGRQRPRFSAANS